MLTKTLDLCKILNLNRICENFEKILNKKIRINGIGYFIFSIIYIYISIFLFLLLWVKPIYTIITSIALSIAIYKYYKRYKKKSAETEPIYIKVGMLFIVSFVVIGFRNNFGLDRYF